MIAGNYWKLRETATYVPIVTISYGSVKIPLRELWEHHIAVHRSPQFWISEDPVLGTSGTYRGYCTIVTQVTYSYGSVKDSTSGTAGTSHRSLSQLPAVYRSFSKLR